MLHAPAALPIRGSGSVIDDLREAILVGDYRPGAKLIQEELATRFGVSRIPLREALRRLEGEGLVLMSPNRGAVVRPLVPKDVADLFELRIALETVALRRAAERYADVRRETERRAREAAAAAAAGAVTALFHLDRDFHASLAEASDNAHLVAALDGQWSQIMRIMHAYLSAARYPANVWPDHQSIAEALAAGNGDAAIDRLARHLAGARDFILATLRVD